MTTKFLKITMLIILSLACWFTLKSQQKFDILADCNGNDIQLVFKIPYAKLFYNLNITDSIIDTASLLTSDNNYYYLTKRNGKNQRYDKDIYELKTYRCIE
jgi:hypothetical protein